MLDFVRPIRLQVERISLADVVRDAIALAESHVPRGGVDVAASSLPEALPPIQGDPHQLRQLFTNLLTNAFEAMGGKGAVGISAQQLAAEEEPAAGGEMHAVPMVQVEVADNGPGVPPDVMDRIFSPFFTTKPQGSGLGLAIVRKIVDAHDGRIDVERARRRRHRFRVTLPVSGSHELFRSGVQSSFDVPVSQRRHRSGADGSRERTDMGRILVADDHDSLRRGIVRALSDAHHEVDEAPNGNVAIEKLHEGQFDVVLSDLKMGGSDGMDVLRTAKSLHPTTAVILMTAFGSVHTAVEAMKIGAFDYVQKPFEIEEMELKIEKAIEHRRLKHEIEYLRHTQQDIYDFDRIVGASGALQSVLAIVKKVAKSNTTVLIRGETGTGKELIAGAIHHNSLRAGRNFVKVNCAALQENLLESELFGHEKGAFTGADKQRVGRFEQADGGTLFLDEIGDMSANTQAKILRVLQEHEFERLGGTRTLRVDVRLIAATNRNLPQMVANGQFREDLYYRLNVVSIEMPPLRERKDDIQQLAMFFLRRFAGELKKRVDGSVADAQKLLMRYNWPGNIRELENAIERAVLLTEGPQLTQRRSAARRAVDRSAVGRRQPGRQDSADRHRARGDRAPGAHRSAEDVELGAEGCGGAARDQPARDELQDQDARHRLLARRTPADGGDAGELEVMLTVEC